MPQHSAVIVRMPLTVQLESIFFVSTQELRMSSSFT